MIDLDTLMPGSKYFSWKEMLYLPKWKIHVYPDPTQHSNLIKLVEKLDMIRIRLGVPMRVTSALRPSLYNEWKDPHGVGGAKVSAHCEGKAIDFVPIGMNVGEAMVIIEPVLEHLGLRMEHPDFTPAWVHLDTRNVMPGGSRIFKP